MPFLFGRSCSSIFFVMRADTRAMNYFMYLILRIPSKGHDRSVISSHVKPAPLLGSSSNGLVISDSIIRFTSEPPKVSADQTRLVQALSRH